MYFMILTQPQAHTGGLEAGAARNTFSEMALSLVQGFPQTKSTQVENLKIQMWALAGTGRKYK